MLAKRIRMAAEGRSRSDYEKIYHLTQMRWNQVQHPLGGLGLLEDQIAQNEIMTKRVCRNIIQNCCACRVRIVFITY